MRVEDTTQTVWGHPVNIYRIDGGKRANIVFGEFWDSQEGWKLMAWAQDGEAHCMQSEGLNLDLHDWRDEIPWSALRDEIGYVARDESRTWYGYTHEPKPATTVWYQRREDEIVYDLISVKMPEGPADWREAIARRPDDKT